MKRKKRVLSLLLCAALVFAFMPVTARAADIWDGSVTVPALGSGSSGEPYQIGTAEELAWFAQQINGGSTGDCAVLAADIELNNTADWADWATTPPANTWIPIGNGTNKFAGSFDGNGYTVSGLYIGSGDKLGLFGCVDAGGNIQNVRVAESYVGSSSDTNGLSRAGGVCGRNNGGSITGCYNHGTVVGMGNFVGGICGENLGTVTGCFNYGSVRGAQSVGGICGMNVAGGIVSGCGNAGNVTSTVKFAGGVCGSLSAATEPRAEILDSFNTGTVQGTTSGGICGYNTQGSISGCYFLNTSSSVGVGNNYQGSVTALSKSEAAFALGEVAYLLGPLFGQTLCTDQIPVVRSPNDDNAVFKLTYLNGEVEHAVQYYNSGSAVSAAGIATPIGTDGECFLGWGNLSDTMPDNDVTVSAVFGAAAAPSITTTSLENAMVGSAYLAPIQVEGSRPIVYSVSSGDLPDGLSLDTDTGEITGIPTMGGTYTFIIQAENTIGSDTQELSITVEATPEITTTSLPSGTVSASYSAGIETEGNSAVFTVTAGSLPAGLSLDASTGIISGTPSAVGTGTFTIKAENTIGCDTMELSITIKKAEPAITTNSLPSGTLCASYSAEIEVEGKTPFAFTVSAGSLPAGLSLDTVTGIVSGIPTVVGTSTFTVHVVNDSGEDSRQLSIEISDQAMGSGTSGDPYQIFTAEQLTWFAEEVNGDQKGIHAVLMADIALNDTSGWENWATNPPANTWTPIGTSVNTRFVGSFDGNNHTISGVYINSSGDYQGLFGYAGVSTIQNFSLTESYIKGKNSIGGICGSSFSTKFNNCYNAGTISGTGNYVGGICGTNNAGNTIQNCHNIGTITGPGYTGGISGINSGTITDCCNEGTINSNGVSVGFGGVCGGNSAGSIIDSYNTGEVYTPSNNNVGGVCGYNPATITNAYNTGTVTGNSNAGTVCGFVSNTGIVTNCYFLGSAGGIGNNLGTGTAAGKSADAFSFGEVAYLLGSSFGQTLGTDTAPVFRTSDDSNAVFKLTYLNGTDEHAVQYYNSDSIVSTAGVSDPISVTGIFSEWAGLPAVMPANDVTATAAFTSPTPVQLISATADGVAGTTTSTKITLVFNAAVTGLTADNIIITDGTGSVAKGALTGSGTTWFVSLASVAGEGDVSVEVSAPEGYTISGTPKTVTVYKPVTEISITTASLAEATVGSAYSQTIECSYTGSGTLQFSATGLPGGLSINDGSGLVGGIPDADTQSGSPYSIVIEVTDGGLTDSKTYLLIVNAAQAPVTTYTVVFNSNGSVYTTKTVNEGESIGSGNWPSNPARTGYTFGGWYTGTNGSGTLFTSSTTVNASITVYAKWTPDGDSSHGGGRSRTPSTPTYKAEVKTGSGTETTLPVTVRKDSGSAAIDISSLNLTTGETLITVPSIPDVDIYSVGIPVTVLSKPDRQGTLTLNTDVGSITLPYNMLTGVAGIKGRKAEITIGQGDKDNLTEDVKAAMGDRPLIQLSLFIDDKQTDWNNPNALVTVSIPYTPTAVEFADPEHITVWYIDGRGNVVFVPSGRYDPATGTVTFITAHFSNYAVVYVTKTFDDLGDMAWARDQIDVLTSKGILRGISENEYAPQTSITRADFLYFLIRTLSIDAKVDVNFDDIQEGAYYYKEIGVAKKLGLTYGIGNNNFSPGASITRQDMMVLTERVLKMLNKLKKEGAASDLEVFIDKYLIADYAADSIASVVKEGLIVGSGDCINPMGNTTRAEAAVFLYRIYNKF